MRTGCAAACSSKPSYSFWFSVPLIQAFASSQAIVQLPRSCWCALIGRMIMVFFLVPRHEIALGRGRRFRPLLDRVLEQHVHEQIHRLGLDHQRPGGLPFAGVEMLVHAVVMDDRDVAGLPIVANAVVDLVARAIENVERGLVDVPVLLGLAARRILLEMDVKGLGASVLGLDIMAAEMLRAAVKLEILSLDDPRQAPQPVEFLLETVGACQGADENPLLVRIMLLAAHAPPREGAFIA